MGAKVRAGGGVESLLELPLIPAAPPVEDVASPLPFGPSPGSTTYKRGQGVVGQQLGFFVARLAKPVAMALLGSLLLVQVPDVGAETQVKPAFPKGQGVSLDQLAAPPPFAVGDGLAVFADIERATLKLTLDTQTRRATASDQLVFNLLQAGWPVIDLVPKPTGLWVDGKQVDPNLLKLVRVPHSDTKTRVLAMTLGPGPHRVRVDYGWNVGRLGYQDDEDAAPLESGTPFSFATVMNDYKRGGRAFMERYAPSNFEFDRHPTTVELELKGGEGHRVLANGKLTALAGGRVQIEYPSWYTASSYYLAVVDPAVTSLREATFTSVDGRQVPVTIAVEQPGLSLEERERMADDALREVLQSLAQGEALAGPFPHAQYVAHVRDNSELGGMEHAGATIVGYLGPLQHEVFHSWFGRGLMPADGEAGVIDEGLASWMQAQAWRMSAGTGSSSESEPPGPAVELPRVSRYQRHTALETLPVYAFIQGLDQVLAPDGGLAPRLPMLIQRFFGRPLRMRDFQQFLLDTSAKGLHAEIGKHFQHALAR